MDDSLGSDGIPEHDFPVPVGFIPLENKNVAPRRGPFGVEVLLQFA